MTEDLRPAGPAEAGLIVAQTPVTAYMSRVLVTVPDDAPTADARRTMLRSGHRHLVVVDAWGRLVGVLQVEDLVETTRARVRDVVRGPAGHLVPTDSMHAAAAHMLTYRTDAVAVVDAGALVGLVTWSDVLRMVVGRGRA